MEEDFEILSLKSKINIDCTICDKCCINRGDLKITPVNVLEISKYLKILPTEFVTKYAVKEIKHKPELLLKAIGDKNRCIFNNEQSFRCMIQKVKPMQCTVFPLVPFNLDLDLFVNSNQCPNKSDKMTTVDKWLNGNNNIYKKYKNFYIRWIEFMNFIEPVWKSLTINEQEEIFEFLYIDYDLKKDLTKQVLTHIEKVISFF